MKDKLLVWANRILHLRFHFQMLMANPVARNRGLEASAEERVLKSSLENKVPDRVFRLDRSTAAQTTTI